MPTLDYIAGLFKQHLATPSNPEPTLPLIAEAELTAQFFDAFIASGQMSALERTDQVQLLSMLGVWCPKHAPNLLKKWITAESDIELVPILKMRLNTFERGPIAALAP